MTERDPYRDERPTLVAENERLRSENAALQSSLRGRRLRVGAAVALLALNAAGLMYVPNLINARDDTHVYLGALAAVALLAIDVWFAVRWFAPRA